MGSPSKALVKRALRAVALVVLTSGVLIAAAPAVAQIILPIPPVLPPPDEPPPARPPPEQPPPAPPPQQPPPQQPPPQQPPPQQPPPQQPPAQQPAAAARFEEDAAAVTATGSWERRGPELAAFSGGTALSSNARGATLTVQFTGTNVSWVGVRCSICGIATVSVDGGATTSVNTGGSAAPGSQGLASESVFTAAGLATGAHTLLITVTGNTTSDGAHIVVDAFDVISSTGGDYTPPSATYSGDDGGDDAWGGGGATDLAWLGLLAALSAARRFRARRAADA